MQNNDNNQIDTCKKRKGITGRCEAFTELICKYQHCWGWTDDPEWMRRYKRELKNYTNREEIKNNVRNVRNENGKTGIRS